MDSFSGAVSSESKSVRIRIGAASIGPLDLFFGVESPLEVIENEPRLGSAGGGRSCVVCVRGVIENTGVVVFESSKKSVARIWS